MRNILLISFVILFFGCKHSTGTEELVFADNIVIAHRGAWKSKNLPQNSIAALKEAIAINCRGSEFDVRMTSDEVLIVTHDSDYFDLPIEQSTYSDLAKYALSNGEKLPTLRNYILAGMEDNDSTGLVCEIKPSNIEGRNAIMAEKTVNLVRELNADAYILTYISFSYDILLKINELDPNAKTQYLDGSKSPEVLKRDQISGLDYHLNEFKSNIDWIKLSKENDLLLNAWTVNSADDMDWLIINDFDFITTDEPELLFERIEKNIIRDGWSLKWSDEFFYKGKLDSSKWSYDYGFISNREEQYFTDRLKNARVEKGKLIIEAHKEKVSNKKFKSDEFENKSWLKYIAEIDSASYTSARINTKNHASWKYGYFEVKAKLPSGIGLWPAIWMLGENRNKVGWPECGEIDIMEHVGFKPDSIFGTIHTKSYNHMTKTEKGNTAYIHKPYEDYHLFALKWTPEEIYFLMDNVVYYHIENEHKSTSEWPFDQKFYLLLNVSVGGMLGGQKGIDNKVFPQSMMVDYVRVFQKDNY